VLPPDAGVSLSMRRERTSLHEDSSPDIERAAARTGFGRACPETAEAAVGLTRQ
jgi:hypothetical protein